MSNVATFGAGAWVGGGSMTTSGSMTVTSAGLNVSGGSFTSSATTTVSAGGVNVSGGVATLNNASSITGGITVTGGTAAFNAANTVVGTVAASGGGAISLGNMSGVGSGSINLDNGTLISTFSSGTLANTVAIGAGGGTVSSSNPFTLSGNVTGTSKLTVAGSSEVVLSGTLSSSSTGMAVDVLAGGSARLTGASNYFYNSSDIGGTLRLDNATITMRNSAVIGGAGAISLIGTSTIAAATGSGSTSTINATISGTGGLVFTNGASSRTVYIAGNNTYSGGTQLVSDVGAASGSAFGTGVITVASSSPKITNTSAGSITLANNITYSGTLAFGGSPIQITGTVTGSGILRASNGGTIDVSQQSTATMLSTGVIDMGNNGVIKASSATNFGSLATILASGTGSGSTLQALGNTGSITQSVKIGATNNNPCNINVDTNGYAVTLAGVIQNLGSGTTGGLVKSGAGTLTLTNANTYTGPTTVNVGGLVLNGSLAVGSNLSVAAAAWLGGTGTAAGVVTVSGTLSPGNSPGVITLGSLVLTSTSVTAIEVASAGTRGTAYDGVTILDASGLTYGGTMSFAFGGSAIADNTTLDIFSFSGSAAGDFATLVSTGFYAGTWTNNSDGTFTFTKDSQTLTFRESTGDVIVVPEPGTALLGVIGALAALASRRGMRRCPFV